MFAPLYHASTARVAAIRRELGVHTTFNLLGPMTNPANAPFQIMGVWHRDLVERRRNFQALGTKKAWVVHGLDGLDEITVQGKTYIAEVTNGKINLFEISPEDFGFEKVSVENLENLRGGNPEQNAKIISEFWKEKKRCGAFDLVLINAAAAIFDRRKSRKFRRSRVTGE